MKTLILYNMYLIWCSLVRTIIQYIANNMKLILQAKYWKTQSSYFLEISKEDYHINVYCAATILSKKQSRFWVMVSVILLCKVCSVVSLLS